jgi:hypothetical protein
MRRNLYPTAFILAMAFASQHQAEAAHFSTSSIWNRAIPATAVYTNVSDALWGFSPTDSPAQLYLDLVTVIFTNPQSSAVNVRLNSGFDYPKRSVPNGATLYQRRIASTAGVQESTGNKLGNGIVVIIDPVTGAADEGGAFWRGSNGADILIEHDRSVLHYNAFTGSGLYNGVRGSGLAGLGGSIQPGEINTAIPHALTLLTSGRLYSKAVGYVWPATRCDSIWKDPTYGYKGPNKAYALGTLLAIPQSVDLAKLGLTTPQALNVAKAAQKYGLYVADSTAAYGNRFALAMEWNAAASDLGLTVNSSNGWQAFDSKKIDANAFQSDMLTILHNVKAVTSNKP